MVDAPGPDKSADWLALSHSRGANWLDLRGIVRSFPGPPQTPPARARGEPSGERGRKRRNQTRRISINQGLQLTVRSARRKREKKRTKHKKKKTQRTDRPMRPWNWGAYILPQPRLQIPVPESGRLGRYFNAQTLNRCCCIWYLSGSLSFPGETDKSRLAPPHQPSTSRIEKLYYHHYCHYYHIFGDYPSSGPVARAISGGETSRKWSCAHVW